MDSQTVSATAQNQSLKAVAKPLLDSLETIEGTLIQVKAIAGEDVLRFPMQMIERMCTAGFYPLLLIAVRLCNNMKW
ncbi:MAG: hypothetical protein IPO83_09940 [Chitinophagaceae bacterium]|nr:hypothetical protein [Chitinophagaceae bacterium]